MGLGRSLVSLEVGFTSKDFIAAVDLTGPGPCLCILLLSRGRCFLLLDILLLLGLGISASATARWHQVAEGQGSKRWAIDTHRLLHMRTHHPVCKAGSGYE